MSTTKIRLCFLAILPNNSKSKISTAGFVGLSAYKIFVSPWLKSLINEPAAECIRQLHPLRMERYTISDQNPLCTPIKGLAELARSQRKIVAQDNPFVEYEEYISDSIKNSLDYYRGLRDFSQEFIFKSLYDNLWMKTFFNTGKDTAEETAITKEQIFQATEKDKVRLRKMAEKGGFIEAAIRVILAVVADDMSHDILEFEAAEIIVQKSRRLRRLTPEQYKKINKEQALILHAVPRKAITSLAQMELTSSDKKKIYDMAAQIALADKDGETREKGLLKTLSRILFPKAQLT